MSTSDKAAALARAWLGTPYRHQASTLGAGCDCLGLVRGVWRGLYGHEPCSVPRYAADPRRDADPGALQRAADTLLLPQTGPLKAGDVVLFQLRRGLPPHHCGVLVAPDRFLHAQERLGVVEAPLTEAWRRRLTSSYTFPDPKI